MITVTEFIQAIGGTRAAQEIAGVQRTSIANWRSANRIPPTHYPRFRRAAEELGIEAPPTLFLESAE